MWNSLLWWRWMLRNSRINYENSQQIQMIYKSTFFTLKYLHIIFSLKMSYFLSISSTCIPIFPFLLFLFINFLYLSIFKGKFQSFYLILFIFFYILRIIRHNFQFIWYFELINNLVFNLLDFLLRISWWS